MVSNKKESVTKKGQVLDIVSSIVFIVILFGIALFAIILTIKVQGVHEEGVVKIVGTSLDDWSISRVLENKIGDRTLFEMIMHSTVTNDISKTYIDSIKNSLKTDIERFGLYTYDITWSNSDARRVGWINSEAKFCGDLSNPTSPRYAYCEQSCSIGRVENIDWSRDKCNEDEKCCVEQYDFTQKRYTVSLCQGSGIGCECGPSSDGFRGIWEFGLRCTPGRISILSIETEEWECCRSATESEMREMIQEQKSMSVLPLIYDRLVGQVTLAFGLFTGEKVK